MKIARNDACPCASGETFAQCHGGSRRELRASARRLHALAEVHDVAALFPFLRPVSSPVLAFAETAADELGEHNGWIPPQVVEEGLALVDDHERRRLVVAYASRYPDRWQSVCDEVGDAATAARVLAASAVRAAIGERRTPPRRVLLEVEREHAMLDTPAKVLAFLLSPGDVWSYEDAVTSHSVV